MQKAFDFGAAADIAYIRDQLIAAFGRLHVVTGLDPVAQLVRALLGVKTRDEVSWSTFERLIRIFPRWSDLAAAAPGTVAAVIHDVTHPDKAADYIPNVLIRIAEEHPDFDLSFLANLSVEAGLIWLERFDGVGRKVSAAALNFSTLGMPAFVIDTHVLRVLGRFGLVGPRATTESAYRTMMAAMEGWSAADLNQFHALLKRLGQTFCGARETDCTRCPIGPRCRGRRQSGKSSRMRVPRFGAS
jgi:endonuclease-3